MELIQLDSKARAEALNPRGSFIVQAPAGSGKTELLIQRYLNLLAHVDRAPEEILAVTFTRKAQGEMKQRILEALENSKQPQPEKEHEKLTWTLAKKVKGKSDKLSWNLEQNPSRLKVMTIDALASHLVHRMPLLSEFGSEPAILENPAPLYHQAVKNLLGFVEKDESKSKSLHALLWHLDNRLELLTKLLVDLLQKRDQWIGHVYPASRDPEQALVYLETCLKRTVENHLQQVSSALDAPLKDYLISEARESADIAELTSDDPLHHLKEVYEFPEPSTHHLEKWHGMRHLILTKEGQIRKRLTKKEGFPAPSSAKNGDEKKRLQARKQLFEQTLESLPEEFVALLAQVDKLPKDFSENDRIILLSLFDLLPLLVAHLKVCFREEGAVDFVEMAQGASHALGTPEEPTELALCLDYQINHILIDEFQDTSSAQYGLFEKLVSNWQAGDGKTLFLVGDPQQSIYRFRGAEVGLFLKVCQFGFHQLPLTFLQLRRNFRAHPTITEFVNETFIHVFPKTENVALGGVKFSPSISNESKDKAKVEVYGFLEKKHENDAITQMIQTFFKEEKGKLAILVRTKSHLLDLIPKLKAAKIPFYASEINPLSHQAQVIDLMTLLKAFLDESDNIAWAALLRTPWCRLSMEDIWHLAHDREKILISQNVWDESLDGVLSENGRAYLRRLRETWGHFKGMRQRKPLSETLKALWYALGGPLCYEDHEPAEEFFACLEGCSMGGELVHFEDFENQINRLYHSSEYRGDGSERRLELMTIHKAKGLEFECVILPSLERIPRTVEPELLLWQEMPYAEEVDLLMAPSKGFGAKDDELFHFVQSLYHIKNELEWSRLLYVAATRAKNRLILTATFDEEEEEHNEAFSDFKKPSKRSFMGQLWPALEEQIQRFEVPEKSVESAQASLVLAPDWRFPVDGLMVPPEEEEDLNRPELKTDFHAPVGTLVHEILCLYSKNGFHEINHQDLQNKLPSWQIRLETLGVAAKDMKEALGLVIKAVQTTLNSEKGQWILQPHEAAQSEYPLVYQSQSRTQTSILDRTFKVDGKRWIIDYKVVDSSTIEVETYQAQLNHYAKLLAKIEKGPIWGGLYFPLTDTWFEKELINAG